MSHYEDALIEASKWLSIPGVETIIPDETAQSIMVLTSCSSMMLCDLIPEYLMGFMVNLYYVHGLNVNKESTDTSLQHLTLSNKTSK